jgi:hypothetical protein
MARNSSRLSPAAMARTRSLKNEKTLLCKFCRLELKLASILGFSSLLLNLAAADLATGIYLDDSIISQSYQNVNIR